MVLRNRSDYEAYIPSREVPNEAYISSREVPNEAYISSREVSNEAYIPSRKVPNEAYIPSDDMEKIRARLVQQIMSMNDAELRIVAKSEASLRAFVADLFKSIAKLFGYIVAQVVGFGRDIVRSVGDGWKEGWKAGLD